MLFLAKFLPIGCKLEIPTSMAGTRPQQTSIPRKIIRERFAAVNAPSKFPTNLVEACASDIRGRKVKAIGLRSWQMRESLLLL